ncbi:MAG TPA: hypothetical protein VNO43_14210 [Candidatus Eisenbacteria bacterium]|nr:hypothetical protein [Candidatus Eisenbacteria bacterium]
MGESAIATLLLLGLFSATVCVAAGIDVPGMWRQLPLRERVLCAFLLIVSSMIVFGYIFNVSSFQTHAFLRAQ